MYLFGTMYVLIGLSYFITQPFAAHVYVPFFHNLKITSAYEVNCAELAQILVGILLERHTNFINDLFWADFFHFFGPVQD